MNTALTANTDSARDMSHGFWKHGIAAIKCSYDSLVTKKRTKFEAPVKAWLDNQTEY